MFYTLIKHGFFTNQSARRVLSIFQIVIKDHKVQTKFYKILKFGVSRPNSKRDTAIWKCQIEKEMYGIRSRESLTLVEMFISIRVN